jgi:membrane-bound ClpP family serine protease
VNHLFRRVILLGATAGLALLVLWGGGRRFEQPGILDIALIILFYSALSDAFLAWENERAIAEGRSKLFNEIVGESAVVETSFSAQGSQFQGKVKLGLARWSANSDRPLLAGEKVRISARQGLLLQVERPPRTA